MTKNQLLSSWRGKYPDLSKYDDDKLFTSIIKKYPEYRDQLDNPYEFDSSQLLSGLPNFVKDAYNESITGVVDSMLTGQKRFDLSGYEPGVLEDIGAGLLNL